jgi:hypothetical protein
MAICKWDTDCAWCGGRIAQGEELFFIDGEKVCGVCAFDHGYVCVCDRPKKPQYDKCFSCTKGEQG